MKIALTIAFFAAAAAAQPIGFGLKVGVPFNDAYKAASGGGIATLQSERQFAIGPSVELRLPFGIGVEADLLYRRLNGSLTTPLYNSSVSGHVWETPVLLKYRMKFPIVRPFVDAGPTFRWNVGGDLGNVCVTSSACASILPNIETNKSGVGMTIGAGVEIKAILIRITPELRYTRWGSSAITVGNLTSTIANANQNQAEFLLGIGF